MITDYGWGCEACGQDGNAPNRTAAQVMLNNHKIVCVGGLSAIKKNGNRNLNPMNADPMVFTGLLPRRAGKAKALQAFVQATVGAYGPSVAPGNALLRHLKQGLNSGTALKHFHQLDPGVARFWGMSSDEPSSDPAGFLTEAVDPAHASLREEIRALAGSLKFLGDVNENLQRTINMMGAKIEALEKQAARAPNFDPKLHKAIKEPTDYTKVFDSDEDGLEEGYNGWPKVRARVVF